jgi:hypothetical protein
MGDLVMNLPSRVLEAWELLMKAASGVCREYDSYGSPCPATLAAYNDADRDLWSAICDEYGDCCCWRNSSVCPSADVHIELYRMVDEAREGI